MGRRDAVQFTLECVAEWRRLGALVTFEPGWETRGNGQSADYEGAEEHHTGTPGSGTLANPFPTRNMLIKGRLDLPGPLCNEATPVGPGDRPQIHVIAAHPANHAGASGGRGTAPLPVTNLFNPRVRGNEVDYPGSRPMTPGQRLAALIHGRGVVNVLRRSTEYIKAHAETSKTGKWDMGYAPGKTVDMAAFRRDAAALGAGPAPAPAPTDEDDDMNQWQDAVLMETNKLVKDLLTGQGAKVSTPSLHAIAEYNWRLGLPENQGVPILHLLGVNAQVTALRASQQELVQAISTLASGQDIDVDALVARIEGVVETAVGEAVGDAAKLVQVEVSVKDAPSKS